MKRYIKSSTDSRKIVRRNAEQDSVSVESSTSKGGKPVFAAADILELLMQITELEPYDISMEEPDENTVELCIGDSVYDMLM